MTLAEFLDWEARQERRWEFDGFAPVAMVGVTREHAEIQGGLTEALRSRLRGAVCRFYGPELKIRTATSIRYPDGFVTCTPGFRGQTVVEDPVVIFEILSPGTEATDRGEKAREYRAMPTVRRYVMLRQDRIAAEVHARDGDTDRWLSLLLFETDRLALPEIGVELPLAELYEGVDLPPLDRRDDEGNPIVAPA
jgi:Uma2 family endonuclease